MRMMDGRQGLRAWIAPAAILLTTGLFAPAVARAQTPTGFNDGFAATLFQPNGHLGSRVTGLSHERLEDGDASNPGAGDAR